MDIELNPRYEIEIALPLRAERVAVLEQLCRSSEFAEGIAPSVWGTTLKPNGFRLNVGQVEVFTLWGNTVRVLLAAAESDPRLGERSVYETPYRSVAGPQSCFDGTASEFLEVRAVLEPLHLEFIQAAALTSKGLPRKGTPHRRSHSPELMAYAKHETSASDGELAVATIGSKLRDRSGNQDAAASQLYTEGRHASVVQTRYERDPKARDACLRHYHYTYSCEICRFNFAEAYGPELGANFIHVHHINSASNGERMTNPIEDLLPVCPNCHAMLHREPPLVSPDRLRQIIRKRLS